MVVSTQPILKCMLQSNWIISPSRGENKIYWKPPPSFEFSTLRSINKHLEQRWVIWIFRRFSEVSTGYQRKFLVVFLERIPNKIETNLFWKPWISPRYRDRMSSWLILGRRRGVVFHLRHPRIWGWMFEASPDIHRFPVMGDFLSFLYTQKHGPFWRSPGIFHKEMLKYFFHSGHSVATLTS